MGRPKGSGYIPIEQRFWTKAHCGPSSECWNWHAALFRCGYGQIRHQGQARYAHRVAWELRHGAVPHGLCVLHTCDNRLCVNPAHLFLGTHGINSWDKTRKGRAAKKLTAEQVRDIRASNLSRADLAQRHGVTVAMIHYVQTRQSWRHVA